MRRALILGWVGLGVLGSAAFAACLPEVTVDESLGLGGTSSTVEPLQGGSGGGAGKGPSSAGAGGAAGTAGMPDNPGGGSAGTGSTATDPEVAGAGGMDSSSAGAGGGGGMGGTAAGAAGTSAAAGAAGAVAMGRCETNQTREEACANYCNLYFDACNDFTGVYTYTDALGCTDICNDSDWPIGNITEKGSVLCRCYHAYRALTEGQTPHCYHAAEVPSMPNGCAP